MPVVTVNDQDLHVAVSGDGPPVLLLHAFPLDGAMWEGQLAHLASRYRLLAPDLPGFGASPPPAEPRSVTIDALAGLVAHAVDELAGEPCVVAGISMGGYLALALHRNRPDLVRALVLADTRAEADDAPTRRRRTAQQRQLEDDGDVEPQVDGLLERVLGADSKRDAELVAHVRALMTAGDPDGWIAALEAMKRRPDSSSELASIEVPTLVVAGEQDELSPPDVARSMAARLPDARLVLVGHAGHLVNLEHPAAFDEALASFLDSLA